MKSPHVPAAPASRVPAPASHAQPQADHRPAAALQRQMQEAIDASPWQVAQRQQAEAVAQRKNTTGLPDNLKAGVENISGYSLDDVQVHYNSAKPAQLQAHAYAQGTDIHVAPGQEQHLPHEAWHVVQQKQGRVKPTVQLKGIGVNDNLGLEHEADVMGAKSIHSHLAKQTESSKPITQCGCKACSGTSYQDFNLHSVAQLCSKDSSCKNSDPCSIHSGTPVYEQRTDKSIFGGTNAPYSANSSFSYAGEAAMRAQEQGKSPAAAQVRSPAGHGPSQRAGAGLDEGFPTTLRSGIASRGDAAEIAAQSGLRGATDKTVLVSPGHEASGHSGAFPKEIGRGSTNTSGQASAHELRHVLPTSATTEGKLLEIAGRYVSSLATGPDIVKSDVLTGAMPNFVGAGRIGATNPSGPIDHERARTAMYHHEVREHMKQRIVTYADANGLVAPLSPGRAPMKLDGSGGEHLTGGQGRPPSPLPTMGGSSEVEKTANAAGYISAPARHGASVHNTPKKCTCGADNANSDGSCRKCDKRLY
jgi:hypothetical protein